MAADDWIDIHRDDAHIARERKKARELKKSAWWNALLQKGICHYCGQTEILSFGALPMTTPRMIHESPTKIIAMIPNSIGGNDYFLIP